MRIGTQSGQQKVGAKAQRDGHQEQHVHLRDSAQCEHPQPLPLLPVHLHELYLSGRELGLILSQKILGQSLTQCQNN